MEIIAGWGIQHLKERRFPFAHSRRKRGIEISEEIVERAEKVEHSLVREKALRIEGREVGTAYLADEGQGIVVLVDGILPVFVDILIADRHFRILQIFRHVRESPPLALSEKSVAGRTGTGRSTAAERTGYVSKLNSYSHIPLIFCKIAKNKHKIKKIKIICFRRIFGMSG